MGRSNLLTLLIVLICGACASCSSGSTKAHDVTNDQTVNIPDTDSDKVQDLAGDEANKPDSVSDQASLPETAELPKDIEAPDSSPDAIVDVAEDASDAIANDAVETVDTLAAPARYPEGRVHSPITPFVVNRMKAIVAQDETRQDDVFMKVGDSITVTTTFLNCLSSPVSLPDSDLTEAAAYFRQGDADGSTPFNRASLAAQGGRAASWAISGTPSPINQEIAAISPRFALIMFGTNDIGWYADDMPAMLRWYTDAMIRLVDALPPKGIIPVLSSIPRRGDDADLDLWVPTLNAIIRGLAETRQIPFLDFHLALEPLTGYGLSPDGVHPNAASGGSCDFSSDGLDHGQNTRNLITMEVLTQLYEMVLSDEPAPDQGGRFLEGTGTPADPIRIDALPFSDWRDTTTSTSREFDTYSCGSGQDESGPEFVYRLELQSSKRLRMMVLDVGNVDIDIHLLDSSSQASGCLARNNTIIQGTLGPGTFHIVADTFVSNAQEHTGPFLLVILACPDDDTLCDVAL